MAFYIEPLGRFDGHLRYDVGSLSLEGNVKRGWLKGVVLGLLIGVVAAFGVQYAQRHGAAHPAGQTDIDLTILKESMQENSEFSTAQYLYTNSISITDQNTLAIVGRDDIPLPFTDATYILQYDGVIKAGFDLSDVEPFMEGNALVIELPAPEDLSHETGDVEVVYEQQNILNPLHVGEESSWIEDQKEVMLERAISLGLYDNAKSVAETTFESMFASAIPEGVTVEVRFQEDD